MIFAVYGLFMLAFMLYLGIRFVQVLVKMRKPVVFPVTKEEWEGIRMIPQKPLGSPTISGQKMAVWFNSLFILFLSIVTIVEIAMLKRNLFTLFVLVPALFNLPKLWNLFVVQEQGILCGARFVPWHKIQSYQFIPIDIHHRFYGHSTELNKGYELMIQTKLSAVSCLVTTEAVKGKLAEMLDEQIGNNF